LYEHVTLLPTSFMQYNWPFSIVTYANPSGCCQPPLQIYCPTRNCGELSSALKYF
jgi:hypothetical protein